MTSTGLYRRIVRRETHSSRSRTAIGLAVLLILLLVWVAVESIVAALGQPALLVAPADGVTTVLGAATLPVAALTAVGAVVAVLGLVLVVLALAPARRGRRASTADRSATIVDDRVIAQSLARTAGTAGDVDPDQVAVSVGRGRVDVEVARTSGRSADLRSIQEAVDEELGSYDFTPRLRARVRRSTKGSVHS